MGVLVAHASGAPAQEITGDEAQAPGLGATPFTIQGFGDIDYIAGSSEGRNGFTQGAFDLFATSRLGDHWSALAELVFETDGNELASDLERFQFTYEQSDALRISVGRMHNPLLRWPITNHHGLFNQTPIERPIVARWEDEPGLWPTHFVGMLAQGRFSNVVGLNYALGVGNGRGRVIEEIQVGSDANNHRAVVASIGISPDAAPGLDLYVSTYIDRIPGAAGDLRERDFTTSASYALGAIEVRGEWSRLRHQRIDSGVVYRTTGWYGLAGYRLSGRLSRLKPFVLVEKLQADRNEVFVGGAQDEEGVAAGLRWDANQWVALKSDYRSRRIEEGRREGVVRAQLAVSF